MEASLRAKPRCALKSTDMKTKPPSPRPIRNTSHQGFRELKTRDLVGRVTFITSGINKMKLFRRIPDGDFRTGQGATSKATMCPEINRYENYGPVPKAEPIVYYAGFAANLADF